MFYTFDIETFEDCKYNKAKECLECKMSFSIKAGYLIGFYDGKRVYYFNDIVKFLDFLIKSIKEKKIIIYAHNFAKFDVRLFIEEWKRIVKALRVKLDFFNIDNKLLLKIKYNNKTIYFYDSFLLLLKSLDKLSKAFDVEHKKIELSKNEYHCLEKIKEYLAYDVISLYEILEKFFNTLENVTKIDKNKLMQRFTIASLSQFILFNYIDNKTREKMRNYYNREEESWIRLGYYGGRTEAFILKYDYRNASDYLYYYDVNSLYPFVMYKFSFPVGKGKFSEDFDREDLIDLLESEYLFLAQVKVKVNESEMYPAIPKRLNNKLLFPVGQFWTYVTSEELKTALDYTNVKILEVERVLYWEDYARIFKDFVKDLYELRKKAKEEKNETLSYILKILLNSSYGKFAQRREWDKLKITKISFDAIKELREKEAEVLYFSYDRNILVYAYKEQDYRNRIINPVYSLFITSYARSVLYYYMRKALENNANVYYVDTDSLFIDSKMKSKFVDSYELGKLKQEDVIKEAIFLGAKQYAYRNVDNQIEVKFKGIQKDTINKLKQMRNTTLLKALLELNEQSVISDKQIKDVFDLLSYLYFTEIKVTSYRLVSIKEYFRRFKAKKSLFDTIKVVKRMRFTADEKREVYNKIFTRPLRIYEE